MACAPRTPVKSLAGFGKGGRRRTRSKNHTAPLAIPPLSRWPGTDRPIPIPMARLRLANSCPNGRAAPGLSARGLYRSPLRGWLLKKKCPAAQARVANISTAHSAFGAPFAVDMFTTLGAALLIFSKLDSFRLSGPPDAVFFLKPLASVAAGF